MRIAIIGSGIAGHAAALALTYAPQHHEVVLYEREGRAGGHAATVDVAWRGGTLPVDTGFIVYNEPNYPHLRAFFDWAGVATQPSDMSFSVSAGHGAFEWCGAEGPGALGRLFAQRRNLASPSFLNMLREILRFQKQATADLRHGSIGAVSLEAYLARHRFCARLQRDYLVPMGAAIWSTSPRAMLAFPAQSFIEFFENHALLQWQRPQWRTVTGGSRNYVERLGVLLGDRIRLGRAVTAVTREPASVRVRDADGHEDHFDHVVLATHAPDSMALLTSPTPQERAIIGGLHTSQNRVVLHADPALMPKRRRAWAAWNFLRLDGREGEKVSVTYWMNALQGLPADCPLFVSLNPPFEPDPALVHAEFSYAHPQFDAAALVARARLPEIQGRDRISWCGAWTGHGFHEDGMRSGLEAAAALGGRAPWALPAAAPATPAPAILRLHQLAEVS
ncbi:MAG: FAD-dependent oxidoreductase [Hyphomicrobiales bacterium]|nr:FAD-dependent oxidoreductase [Hyphomicrobiales bacterium]